MTRQEAEGKRFLGNFTFCHIVLFDKPLRVYGFFMPFYLNQLFITTKRREEKSYAFVLIAFKNVNYC